MSIENESIIDINKLLEVTNNDKLMIESGSSVVESLIKCAKEKIGKIEIRRRPKYLAVAADPNKNYI